MQHMVRVLICGESHMASEQHFKGFNHLFVASYSTFIHLLRTPLEERGHTVTWMAAHEVPNDFPFEAKGLADFDVVLISDVGADSFLLHPDTWRHGLPRKNRLKMLREWVEAGHGLGMIGGWMTFAGYLGQARYAFSPLSSILPVKVLPYDDRMEIPEGAPPEPIAANHPILRGLEGKAWPDLMGYNLTEPKPDSSVLAKLDGAPLLAVANAGRGRTLAWTSDISPAWCPEAFSSWAGYGQLFSQAVSWLANEA
jgi:uncharacterized membrane protein